MKVVISSVMTCLALVVVLLALSPSTSANENGFAGEQKPVFTKHFQNTLFDITKHALYSVEILLDDKEYPIGKNVVGIVLHNARDEDVRGARFSFVVKDLATGANSRVMPVVTDKGNGLYIISGLDLRKEGKWELAITVKKGHTEDRVKFVFPDSLNARVPKGRYSP